MAAPKISPEARQFCCQLSALFRRLGSEAFRGKQNINLTWTGYLHVQGALEILNSHHSVLEQRLVIDLEYLQSVLERIPNLSITCKIRTGNPSWLYLTGLRRLHDLELRNVPLDLVHGLDKLRDQLCALKISSCNVDLEDVLSHCLGDIAHPREWRHLTTLTLSHNKLTNLSGSLLLTPHVHTFLASHNALTQTTGLESLQRLHTLSLSYNSLSKIPCLSPECTLTTLSIGYNRLETLSGLECLIYLESLDITGNCLMHHDVLAPVSALSRLRQLDSRYNPLSTHPNHRTITSSWLHSDVVNVDFLLDRLPLSKREILQIGTSRLMISAPLLPRDESGEGFDLESASARGSREGSVVSGITVTTAGGGRVRRKKKKRRVREAVICDQPLEDEYTDNTTSNTEQEDVRNTEDDLDPVREMEKLRKRFGQDNWLREKSGETLNQLLGIQSSASQVKEPATKPKPELSPPSSSSSTESVKETPVKATPPPPSPPPKEEAEPAKSDEADCFYSMYRQGDKETSPALSEDCRLSVERMIPGDDSGDSEKLTLTINKEFIREQGPTGGTRVKWFLHSLEGCDMLKCEGGRVTAHLIFNTVRRDRRERVYILSEEGYARLVAATGSQLEQMSRGVSGLTYLQCIKCQSIFSQELADNGGRKKSLVVCCVNCGSNMVIECEGPEKEEADVSLGIPACEALDLENIENTASEATELKKDGDSFPERTYLRGGSEVETPNLTRRSSSGKSLSIQVDIHDHEIKNPESSLPDLLPRHAREGTSGRKKSRSPTDIRSGSSSDISIISDNSIEVIQHTDQSTEDRVVSSSPSSIEVIHHTDTADSVSSHSPGSNASHTKAEAEEREEAAEDAAAAGGDAASLLSSTTSAATLQASSCTVMQESSSSGSLVSSVILNTKVEQGKQDSEGSSLQSSPTKKDDRSEDESVYHSCSTSADETNISNPDISVHEGTPVQSSAYSGSMSSTPRTVRSRTGSPYSARTGSPSSASTPVSKIGTPLARDLNNSVSDSSKNFYSAENSLNSTITANQDTEVPVDATATKPFRKGKSPVSWNFEDFSLVDHRIRLFCEINLFHQADEELLVVAKGDIFVKSALKMFHGLLVLSNKKIYVLKGAEKESEEPRDWLEQLTSVPISRLQRLVQLLGGQGVALELAGGEGKPPSTLYFGRLGGAGYSGLSGENCYYIIFADSAASKNFIDQTVDLLQERVRSNPIPVVKELHYDEELLLAKQIQADTNEPQRTISSFHLAFNSKGELISVIFTDVGLVLASNFFTWVFLEKGTKLKIHQYIPATLITQLEIYQSLVDSLTVRAGEEIVHLTFQSEKGLQRFVRGLRTVWEKENNRSLEDITGFHPTGAPTILKMTALMEESVSFKDFDFSQWIKVTTLNR